MRINKEYNVEEIIKEVERCIEATRQKNIGINISIDILTAQDIVDILKTIPENGSEGNEAKCYGKYDEDDMACMLCELERDCKEAAKNGELEKPHCFGEYTNNCELLYKKEPCEYIDECRVEKEEREKKKERNETLCDDCLMSCCCHEDCTNEHITKQMLGDLAKCFGKSFGKRRKKSCGKGGPIVVCETCKYAEQCEVLTKHE